MRDLNRTLKKRKTAILRLDREFKITEQNQLTKPFQIDRADHLKNYNCNFFSYSLLILRGIIFWRPSEMVNTSIHRQLGCKTNWQTQPTLSLLAHYEEPSEVQQFFCMFQPCKMAYNRAEIFQQPRRKSRLILFPASKSVFRQFSLSVVARFLHTCLRMIRAGFVQLCSAALLVWRRF